MSSINPDTLRKDLIVQARTNEKNHMFQITYADYREADRIAKAFGLDVGPLLLSFHGHGEPLPGQEDLLRDPVGEIQVKLASASDHVQRSIERQSRYRGIEVNQYLADLALRQLTEDETDSVLDPSNGTVIAGRKPLGEIWKSIRLADSEPKPPTPVSALKRDNQTKNPELV
jgi:hypothetical protein